LLLSGLPYYVLSLPFWRTTRKTVCFP
jgi:hypothetical protein